MYPYARDNPLRFVDPTGQYVCDGNQDQCARIQPALENAQKAANNLKDPKEKSALEKAIKFYGKEG